MFYRNLFFNGGSIVGLAFRSGICNSSKFNCIEENNTNISFYGRVQAHEIGHNFGCVHQDGSTLNIMNSTANVNSSIWTATDVTTITNAKKNNTCFSTCGTTGINEIIERNTFSIFPNPSSGTLTITSLNEGDVEVNIYNTTGSVVLNTGITGNAAINVSKLAPGVYIAEIKTQYAVAMKRWVKM